MNKNNVLIFEDDGSALAFIDALQEFDGFDIYKTTNWSYVASWLEVDPKADTFAALIFDLRVPSYKLGVYNNDPYKENKHLCPSLYFINNYIRLKHPELLKRIIIYSAYLHEYERNGYSLDEFIKFDKHEDGSVKRMMAKIREMRGDNYEQTKQR